MDSIFFPENKKPRKPKDESSLDFFRGEEPKREPEPHVPHQPSSATSIEAAHRITPVFQGNRKACLAAISHAGEKGITRKQIAEAYFEGKQNYVTGPVAVLIEEGFVYECPARDRYGAIQQRPDGTVIPMRVDGSAVLMLTPKGKAVAA